MLNRENSSRGPAKSVGQLVDEANARKAAQSKDTFDYVKAEHNAKIAAHNVAQRPFAKLSDRELSNGVMSARTATEKAAYSKEIAKRNLSKHFPDGITKASNSELQAKLKDGTTPSSVKSAIDTELQARRRKTPTFEEFQARQKAEQAALDKKNGVKGAGLYDTTGRPKKVGSTNQGNNASSKTANVTRAQYDKMTAEELGNHYRANIKTKADIDKLDKFNLGAAYDYLRDSELKKYAREKYQGKARAR